MLSAHASQCLPIKDCQPRRILTGIEREFGRATFEVAFPVDAEVVKVLHKYPPTIGAGGIKKNPTTTVVYMDARTKVFDVLEFDHYHCMHQHFGFDFVLTKDFKRLVPGARIEAGTVIGRSPTLDDQGNYRLGLNAKVVMMSIPGIIEDGVVVSESYCKRNTTTCIESRDASWGKSWFPLNLYGDDQHYRPFPDIGDRIRDDGLIFALRRIPMDDDIIIAPFEMSPAACREVDYFFDRTEYGHPGATVIDITVRHEDKPMTATPEGMEEQAAKYYKAECLYQQGLLDCYKQLWDKHKEHLVIAPKFQAMLREARMYLPCQTRSKSTQMYQLQPLDDWRIDLTYRYDFVPDIGSKITGLHGDKGIICSVWKDSAMPVDAWGNRAEVIVAALSTVDRMNIGRPIEHEVNGCMETLTDALRAAFDQPVEPLDQDIEEAVSKIHAEMARRGGAKPAGQVATEAVIERVGGDPQKGFEELLHFYELASPRMRELFDDPAYTTTAEGHLKDVLNDGMYLWSPTDNPKPWVHLEWDDEHFDREAYEKAVQKALKAGNGTALPHRAQFGSRFVRSTGVVGDLTREYPARRGPVWYRGVDGREFITVDDIMIASTYMVLLEKTGSDWSGVASARRQHHGLPAKLSKWDKNSLPSRANPIRALGEAEGRLATTTVGSEPVAEMLEMTNSPAVHKNVCENILLAEQPSNIEDVIDRSKVPLGSSRSQVYMAHAMECAGLEFFYVDHSDQEEIYPADPIGVRSDLGLEPVEDDDDDEIVEGEEDGEDDASEGEDNEESASED